VGISPDKNAYQFPPLRSLYFPGLVAENPLKVSRRSVLEPDGIVASRTFGRDHKNQAPTRGQESNFHFTTMKPSMFQRLRAPFGIIPGLFSGKVSRGHSNKRSRNKSIQVNGTICQFPAPSAWIDPWSPKAATKDKQL